jgi:CTP-dependent riboflavin kinase
MKNKERKLLNKLLIVLYEFRICNNRLTRIQENIKSLKESDISKMLSITEQHLKLLLKKLMEDGYLTINFYSEGTNIEEAFLKEEGRILQENGGYKYDYIKTIKNIIGFVLPKLVEGTINAGKIIIGWYVYQWM